MSKKQKDKRKKRRLNFKRFFLALFFLVLMFLVIYIGGKLPIKNIIIKNNKLLSDQETIEIAKLSNYPSFFLTSNYNIKKLLNKNDYIKKVEIKRGFLKIIIKVYENKVLYIDLNDNTQVLLEKKITNKKKVQAPFLINEVPKNILDDFINSMNIIEYDILIKVSQIEYNPNDIDANRFLLYMNDGNRVYLTIGKFDKINKYNAIVKSIGKKRKKIYLDYGNYIESY